MPVDKSRISLNMVKAVDSAAFDQPKSTMTRPFPAAVAIILLLTTAASAASSPAERRGRAYANAHCARCHAIDRHSDSRLALAPPFRSLHNRYPVETLAEALAEGISTGHPDMPAVELEPDEINDLLAFLKSLE